MKYFLFRSEKETLVKKTLLYINITAINKNNAVKMFTDIFPQNQKEIWHKATILTESKNNIKKQTKVKNIPITTLFTYRVLTRFFSS